MPTPFTFVRLLGKTKDEQRQAIIRLADEYKNPGQVTAHINREHGLSIAVNAVREQFIKAGLKPERVEGKSIWRLPKAQ